MILIIIRRADNFRSPSQGSHNAKLLVSRSCTSVLQNGSFENWYTRLINIGTLDRIDNNLLSIVAKILVRVAAMIIEHTSVRIKLE